MLGKLKRFIMPVLAILAFTGFLYAIAGGVLSFSWIRNGVNDDVFKIGSFILGSVSLAVMTATFYLILWDIRLRNRPFIYIEKPTFSGTWILLSIKNCGTLKGNITRYLIRYFNRTSDKKEVIIHSTKQIGLYPNEAFTYSFNRERALHDSWELETYIEYTSPNGEMSNLLRTWKIEPPYYEFELVDSEENPVEGKTIKKIPLNEGQRA